MKIHICIDLFPYTCAGYAHAHIHSWITASYDKRRKTEQGKNQDEMKRWHRKSAGAKDQKKTHTHTHKKSQTNSEFLPLIACRSR